MFGIGFQELILLSLIGLVVLGPERLPRVANQIGTWLGQARRMTRVMKRQLEDELNFEKEFTIQPPSREPSTQPTGVPNSDDHYSAAHDVAAAETESAVSELPAASGLGETAETRSGDEPPAEAEAEEETSTDREPAAKENP